jgi:hypothetical protein
MRTRIKNGESSWQITPTQVESESYLYKKIQVPMGTLCMENHGVQEVVEWNGQIWVASQRVA